MSKRRVQSTDDDDAPAPESLTPEERRIQRRRDRAQAKSGKRRGFGSPARRAALLAIPAGVILVVVLFILYNPFNIASPCVSLTSPTATPAYPPHGTTDFNGTWCPKGTTSILIVEDLLKISINGTNVALPAGMGQNTSFSGYTCTLPIYTTTAAQGPVPGGADFVIVSPWDFSYNLSWLFGDWAATSGTVDVDSGHPSQPVEYSSTDLLGFTTDTTHHITLFVDNQPSNAGPGLVLPTLDYATSPGPTPGCIARVYGTGHTILLSYSGGTTTSATAGIRAPGDATGPGNPYLTAQYWNGPIPRMDPDVTLILGAGPHDASTLRFLVSRPVPGFHYR